MKKLILIMLLFVVEVQAQTSEEWLRQKKTQKKYLLQQIASLQVYTGYLQKGYSIVRNGLNTINNIKKGDFNVHDKFFSALKEVNPKIRNYTKVAQIIALEVKIVQTCNRTYRQVQNNGLFSRDEISYIYRVLEKLKNECAANIDELITIISNNKLDLKDDERLKRIDALYKNMQDMYTFIRDFSNDTKLLAIARAKEKNSVQTSRLMNGIKNQ